MRVLLVCPWDHEVGGVASVVGHLACHLRDRGHEVLFLHPGDAAKPRYRTTTWGFPGIELNLRAPWQPERPLRRLVAFPFFLPWTFFQLLRYLRSHKIQVVNVHYPIESFWYLALCRWLLPIRLVCSVHGADLFPEGQEKDHYPWALRFLLRAADLIVAPSASFRADLTAVFPVLEKRVVFIRNGVDLEELGVSHPEMPGPTQKGFVLCIAAHNEKKALDSLLRAWAELGGMDPPRRLLLAGDGPLRSQLEELADRLGIRCSTEFLGSLDRENIARLLRGCEVLVLPSRSEPFGIALIEAMACAKPVIGSAVGGIPEIIEDGRNGLLVAPDDPTALADALRRLMEDQELARSLAIQGRHTVRESFLSSQTGAHYEEEFTDLLD